MTEDLLNARSDLTPERALEALLEGNRRWVDGRLAHPNRSLERREALAGTQNPFATVFSCIDSRVPPEIVFDCGIGDLAVIRTGAHVLDLGVVRDSVRFGVETLGTPLVLVLGHQACGAVTAAVAAIEKGGEDPEPPIVGALRPAYETAGAQNGDTVDLVVRAQTRLAVQAIAEDEVIGPRAQAGRVKVVGAYYSFDTGAVSILE